MYAMEFVADKIPYVDSTWDVVSTAIRPTVGAVIGVLLAGDADTLDQAVSGTVGGGTALASHLVKAGSRLAINASPEPVTNILASLVEDVAVLGVVWFAIEHPRAAAAVAAVFLAVGLVVLYPVAKLVRRGWRRYKNRGVRGLCRTASRPMSRVVVVGGGFGGLASAARLAKLGHEVTLLERLPELGGALAPVTAGDFSWDAGPTSMLLPAVVRDLFRKSGRPAEREIDIVPLPFVREHVFEDASVVRLPGESRAAQIEAFDGLKPGLGQQWVDHVASYADDWEVLRRAYLEVPWTPDVPRPRRSPRGWTRGRCCTSGSGRRSRTSGCARSRRTRSSPRGTTCATCRRGPVWSPTSSSGSARGRSRAGWACSRRP